MKNITDPYWCFIAGQSNSKIKGAEREALVKNALERLYKKLEGKKIFITVENDKHGCNDNEKI